MEDVVGRCSLPYSKQLGCEDTSRVPFSLETLQAGKPGLTPETSLNRTSPRSILIVGPFLLIRATRDGDTSLIILVNLGTALEVRVPDEIVPARAALLVRTEKHCPDRRCGRELTANIECREDTLRSQTLGC